MSNGPRLKIALKIQFAQHVAQVLNANVLFMAINWAKLDISTNEILGSRFISKIELTVLPCALEWVYILATVDIFSFKILHRWQYKM